jgi:hypothetical protein
MASQGGRKKLRNGLTPKENAFKNKIIKQIAETGEINGTQAALEVYDTKDPKVAGVIAVRKLEKDSIKEEIEDVLNRQGLDLESILGNVKGIAQAPMAKAPTPEVVLKANLELLKLHGAYPDKNKGPSNLTINQKITNISYSEAKERLSRMSSEASDFIADAD